MKVALVAVLVGCSISPAAAQPAQTPVDRVGQAYEQFLLGHRSEKSGKIDAAVAAYQRAMQLDPGAAEIPAELGALYLRQNRAQDALNAAEQAIKIDPRNAEANRVAGFVYASQVDSDSDRTSGRGGQADKADNTQKADENLTKAVHHFEVALERDTADADPNVRATLARLYLRAGTNAKAIPLLSDLVAQVPDWQDGPLLLAEAFAGSGRNADAITWLERIVEDRPQLYPTLADFYEREHRWKDAAGAYAEAVDVVPKGTQSRQLKLRYASALMNAGGREDMLKARDVLNELIASNGDDGRALYLLSQAQRRLGDIGAAEATARRVIAQNAKSPWGYYALAETLEERRRFQAAIDMLTPVLNDARAKGPDRLTLSLLLPHLGFAHQELGQVDKAITIFQEAHRLSPDDPSAASYLIQAYINAKKYGAAIQLADEARVDHPNDLRLARLEAQALRQSGKAEQGIALLETVLKANGSDPSAYIALAQAYSESDRGDQAVKVLQDAQVKFPADRTIPFELGAVYDKQKRFSDAEAAFKQVLARDPDNAPALNYLGYMLAERGERLDESVSYIKKALQLEPENGSYLDSLGWAYYKADQLDLAEENLKRAADQMTGNSVIQDHYGDVLFKRGRIDDAIAAWTRALAGDRDAIDAGTIDKKIKSAKQKLGRR
jgi:tetratricopeptide (TPR) repeat protein